MHVRTLHDAHRHLGWDRALPPAAEVAPGEELELVLADCFDGQLDERATASDVARLDLSRGNPLTGPVRVHGARLGDALAVELLDVAVGEVGWTTVLPGFGLLADDFPTPHVVVSEVGEEGIRFGDLARLPLAPFLGTLGVAPSAPGVHGVIPPRHVGGNLDCRDVAPGATLLLPVEVEGALLSAGDGHAAQGDGEVCGTAVEVASTARLRVDVRRGAAPPAPQLELPPRTPAPSGARHVTMGVGPGLEAGARDAVRAMIEWLDRTRRLAPVDAYALCSVAGHLRIAEIVDAPNWVVAFELDLAVLDGVGRRPG
jgi:acetamidase/formamidase